MANSSEVIQLSKEIDLLAKPPLNPTVPEPLQEIDNPLDFGYVLIWFVDIVKDCMIWVAYIQEIAGVVVFALYGMIGIFLTLFLLSSLGMLVSFFKKSS